MPPSPLGGRPRGGSTFPSFAARRAARAGPIPPSPRKSRLFSRCRVWKALHRFEHARGSCRACGPRPRDAAQRLCPRAAPCPRRSWRAAPDRFAVRFSSSSSLPSQSQRPGSCRSRTRAPNDPPRCQTKRRDTRQRHRLWLRSRESNPDTSAYEAEPRTVSPRTARWSAERPG